MRSKKFVSISDFFSKHFKKIDNNIKLAFLFTACSTFFTHLIFFVNRWANEDDLHFYVGESNMIATGRWMLGDILSSKYLSPVILLLITMVFMGLISVMVNKMFKIDKKLYIFVISLLLSSFPVLALGFGYGFMVERYVMGMFFATLSVYLTDSKNSKLGIPLGSISLAITLGYYQSYVAMAIALILLKIIIDLFDRDIKECLKYIAKFLLMGLIGAALYLIIVRLVCHFTGISLLEYKGVNNMGSLPPLNTWGHLLLRTYANFFGFFLGIRYLSPFWYGRVAQIILCVTAVILGIYIIIKERTYKKRWNTILIVLFCLLVPLGFNFINFIAYESGASSLNIYQFVFILIIPFILLNRIECKNKNKGLVNVLSWVAVISGLLSIWNNTVITNIYYLKINDYYTSTVELTNRVYDRIEQTPGYSSQVPVMIGNKKGVYLDRRVPKDYSKIFLADQGLWDQFIGYGPMEIGGNYKFHSLVQNILGVNMRDVSSERRDEIYNSNEYEKMESWPSPESLKYIDDVLVVKLS